MILDGPEDGDLAGHLIRDGDLADYGGPLVVGEPEVDEILGDPDQLVLGRGGLEHLLMEDDLFLGVFFFDDLGDAELCLDIVEVSPVFLVRGGVVVILGLFERFLFERRRTGKKKVWDDRQ